VLDNARVQIIKAIGHAPAHQLLYIELQETGLLVFFGDLYHFRSSRASRRTPIFHTSPEETLSSMGKVESLQKNKIRTLWIEHVRALAYKLGKAPLYYR
jgi:glyoxylase-like metal-dependent hydrolase (beta-lactamase superfamily II)